MGEETKIEWTDHTFNSWWGCTRVARLPDAPGSACDHCYAATLAQRFGVRWGARSAPRLFEAKHWNNPIRWDRKAKAEGVRRRVFCASMGDVFERRAGEHGATLDEQRARLWPLIEACDGLDWQLLTKRPENVPGMVPPAWLESWPAHVHVGTTIACQADADARVPDLLRVPARVRFVSAEPLLGPVDLTRWVMPIAAMPPEEAPSTWTEWNAAGLWSRWPWIPEKWQHNIEKFWLDSWGRGPRAWLRNAVAQRAAPHGAPMVSDGRIYGVPVRGRFVHTWNNMCILVDDEGVARVTSTPSASLFDAGPESSTYQQLQWVIVGGESGNGARPMHPQWVRDLRDQCGRASTPFLFKQWGEWVGLAARYPYTRDDDGVRQFLGDAPTWGKDTAWGTLGLDGVWAIETSPWNGRDDVAAPDGMHEAVMVRFGKHAAGRLIDGRTHDGFPVEVNHG